MGAEQIGNFLPVPRPPAQTLLGTCGADGCQVCSTGGHSALRWPPKCSDRVPPSPLASPSPLNPDPPNPRLCLTPGVELRELRSFVFPPGLSLLLWEMGPRAVPGPSPHPGARSRCLGSFLISSQQCRSCRGPDPSGLLIINFYCSARREHVCSQPGAGGTFVASPAQPRPRGSFCPRHHPAGERAHVGAKKWGRGLGEKPEHSDGPGPNLAREQ